MLSLCPESWSKAIMVIGISPTVRGTTEKKAGVAEFPLASSGSCTAFAVVSAVHSPFTVSIFTITCGDKAMRKSSPGAAQNWKIPLDAPSNVNCSVAPWSVNIQLY